MFESYEIPKSKQYANDLTNLATILLTARLLTEAAILPALRRYHQALLATDKELTASRHPICCSLRCKPMAYFLLERIRCIDGIDHVVRNIHEAPQVGVPYLTGILKHNNRIKPVEIVV